MCASISNSDNQSQYQISENDTTFIKTDEENSTIIELEECREEVLNEKESNSIRKVDNIDLLNENQLGNKDKLNVRKDNDGNGLFGNYQKKCSTWVQFQSAPGTEIPLGGREPLFYEPETRNSFVLFVLMIVFVMLACTAAFNIVVYITDELRELYLRFGFFIGLAAMILVIGVNYAMTCLACTRKPPCNYICLILAVIGMSNVCAFITVRYQTNLILYAVVATTVVIFVCMLLALSNFDFTKWMIYVVVISVAFGALTIAVSMTMLLTGTYFKTLHLIILFAGTLLNCVILIIELQTLLGGRAVELSEDDYALGAFLIYTSIVDIFLKMLQMMGLFSES